MNKMEPPHHRTLDTDIPELKPFLQPGMKVLDIGCGFGTITLGVADLVTPGEVVGIDPGIHYIEAAREWADYNGINNITFHVGDSHHLDFPDDTFDVIYSHTVLHFFLDPVLGLREQKRVAKKGGWVIASGVRDWIVLRHPPCPNWNKVYDAYHHFMSALYADYQASGQDPVTYMAEQYKRSSSMFYFMDMHAGRKCAEWFHKAGLADMRIEVQPRRVKHQGHEAMKQDVFDMLVLDETKSELVKQMEAYPRRMIAMGLLDEETVERAKEEARAWYKDPGAFQFWPEMFAVGRVL